jgi:DNA-directed RNA polymerase subunit RPC12/RpoP
MRKLTPKDYDETEFDTVVNGKLRIFGEITNIKNRFLTFDNSKNNLETLTQPYTKPCDCKGLENLACDLYKLYDSSSQDTEKIKSAVKSISSIKCPYCGIDTPSHLDHFLPRSKFPEFSIYAPNLIYVCSICNSKYKGDDVVNQNGERKYFNPYFDDFIVSNQFLKCKIEVDDGMYPTFKFYIEDLSTTQPYAHTIMKNHFENMKLEIRYMEQIAKEKFRQFKVGYINLKARIYYETTLEEIKRDIEKRLREYQEENINNWEKVFWESLRDSDDCLNLIVDKLIPID